MESYFRGVWAQHCATEADLREFLNRGALPGLEKVLRRLDRIEGAGGMFSTLKKNAWDVLSDFSHGGLGQVLRWFSPSGIEPTHSESDVVKLLAFVDSYALMALVGLRELGAQSTDEHLARAKELSEFYET